VSIEHWNPTPDDEVQDMTFRKIASALVSTFVIGTLIAVAPVAASSPGTRQISASGTSSFHSAGTGTGALQDPEFAGGQPEDGAVPYDGQIVDRSQSGSGGAGGAAGSGKKAKSNPTLDLSFNGLNFRQQRTANGGNQFSVEPPDQGMCAGTASSSSP